jgi:PAS domain S-box-containing protein
MLMLADAPVAPSFPAGGGQLGRLIRAHDWAATPLGDPGHWPQSLRSAVSICLHSSFPTAIYWGPELLLLYNDAWAPIPGERHPDALGRPGAEVWYDIWDVVGPQFARVLETGEGFSAFDQMLPMIRGGLRQETYWNYSFTPIRGEDGSVAGIFNQGHETTDRVLGERRGRFLLDLSDRQRGLSSPNAIIAASEEALGLFLGAQRVGYGDLDEAGRVFTTHGNWTDGTVPSREGSYDLMAFGEDVYGTLRRGEPLVIADVQSDPRTSAPEILAAFDGIDTRALVTASLVKDGAFLAALYVHCREPRGWFQHETQLVADVAERTWAAVERARAEESQRESDARFAAITNSIDNMIWSTQPDGFHDYFNDRWYEFTGVPHGSTDGEGWNGIFHPEDQDRAWTVWRNSLATGDPYEIEYRLRHHSGEYRWVIGRAHCVRNAAGAIVRWYGTCTDIHALKQAEEALAEQARVLEILNRTGTAFASEIDLERVVQTVTDAGVELTGASAGAFFYNVTQDDGEKFSLYTISGAEKERFAAFPMPRNTHLFEPTFRGEAIVRSDDITVDPRYGRTAPIGGMPQGHLTVRSYLAVPVVSRSGAVIGCLLFGHPEPGVFTERSERLVSGIAAQAAIAIDNARLFLAAQDEIAARRRQEVALRESEAFSRSVVESSGDCITVVELDGSLQFMNGSGRTLMEIEDFDRLVGTPWRLLWPEDSHEAVESATDAARAGGVGRFSTVCPTAKGGRRWWDTVVTPAIGTDGHPARIVSISRDVTEQRSIEESRQLLLRELNHRVKNLFAIVAGMVTMTARTSPTVQAMSEALKGRISALAKAHELIRSAIVSDMEDGQSTSLRSVVEEVIRPHVAPGDSEQVEVTGPEVALAVGAATNMALILHELATNAAKYGALARPDGRLFIGWRVEDGGRFMLDWREDLGGDTIEPPRSQGFGSKLARSSAAGPLAGTIAFDWRPEGAHITLQAPVARLAV